MASWKLIEGIESAWVRRPGIVTTYEISEDGNIRNARTGRAVKQYKQKDGYLQASLSKDNKPKTYLVHRLVAKAWCDNQSELSEVNHKDGDKTNNHYTNLEWVSHKQNMLHAKTTGLLNTPKQRCKKMPPGTSVGVKNNRTTLTENDVVKIRQRLANGDKQAHIARDYGTTPTAIYCIKNRRTWNHLK